MIAIEVVEVMLKIVQNKQKIIHYYPEQITKII